MRSVIVVHETFTNSWPFVAERLEELWSVQGTVELVRVSETDTRNLGR